MRAIIILVLFLIWSQDSQAKQVAELSSDVRYELANINNDYQKLRFANIWDSIKHTANHAWEAIKVVANKTKEKLIVWIQKIKNKAQELETSFKELINKLKDRVNEIIKDIKVTNELVKKCLQQRKQEIDEIIKNIILDVTICISNTQEYLSSLENQEYDAVLNKTKFFEKIQDKLYVCLKKDDMNIDECVDNVRKGIYEETERTEEVILQNHIEARSSSDDLLSTVIGCTTDGVIKSSSAIANETVVNIECVSQGY